MRFHHVGQAGLKLLTCDPPALASQSAGITGAHSGGFFPRQQQQQLESIPMNHFMCNTVRATENKLHETSSAFASEDDTQGNLMASTGVSLCVLSEPLDCHGLPASSASFVRNRAGDTPAAADASGAADSPARNHRSCPCGHCLPG
ncbi:hypothetical protein AAY473_024111 [Plecturocebus cupreus]